jgi:hypothetical protein
MLEAWRGFYCLSSPGAEFARGEVDFENFGDGRRDLAHSDESEIAMNGDVGPISMNIAHRSHNDMSGRVCTSPGTFACPTGEIQPSRVPLARFGSP